MRFNLLIVTWFETLRWQFTTPGRSLILQWCYGIWHSSAQMLATITFGVHAYCTYLLYLYQIEIYIISKQISPIHYSPFWPSTKNQFYAVDTSNGEQWHYLRTEIGTPVHLTTSFRTAIPTCPWLLHTVFLSLCSLWSTRSRGLSIEQQQLPY